MTIEEELESEIQNQISDEEIHELTEGPPSPTEEGRIPTELEQDIKNSYLNEHSDFIFIKEIKQNPDKKDLVTVIFKKPFGEDTIEKQFEMPDTKKNTKYPPIKRLYETTDADIRNPSSILNKSIEIEKIETDRQVKNNDKIEKESESTTHFTKSWVPQDNRLYPEREPTPLEEKAPKILLPLAIILFIPMFLSPAISAFALILSPTLLFIATFIRIHNRMLRKPKNSEQIRNPSELNEGDTIVLDNVPTVSKDDRDVYKITNIKLNKFDALSESGTQHTIKHQPNDGTHEWASIEHNKDYNKIYRLN